MRRQIVALTLGVALAGACALASACGIDLSGTGSADDAGGDVATIDATGVDGATYDVVSVDATRDGAVVDTNPSPDAAPDASADAVSDTGGDSAIDCGQAFTCGDTCVAFCTGCPAAPVQCNANRVCGTSCADCPGETIDCAYCQMSGISQICAMSALDCAHGTTEVCPCADGDAADCPAANQVCQMIGQGPGFCGTCGDPATQGKTCANGTSCTSSTGVCQ